MVAVLVSGASGFVAQQIVKLLVERGYTVVGTVRSREKGERLRKNLGSPRFSYEIVEDIGAAGALDETMRKHPEVTVFLHTASPFHFSTEDPENDLLLPAINGTRNALASTIKYAPQIERVVITSSYAAVFNPERELDPNYVITEKSWNETKYEDAKANAFVGYLTSKALAERAAWDFLRENKPHFALSTVNPSYVFGPQAFDSELKETLNTSSEIINSILKLKPDDKIPANKGGFIDVRDVAKAHLVAFEDNKTVNKRLLLTNKKFHTQLIADIINDNFPSIKGKIPIGTRGSGKQRTKKMAHVDNLETKRLLGFEFIDLEKTVVDSVSQIIRVKSKL